jgi:hypothetical protein
MTAAGNVGPAGKIEMRPSRVATIATKERLPALLCVLVVACGVIFGLLYVLGLGLPSHP